MILEVKWDEFLPDIIRDAVSIKDRRATAFSKYAAGIVLAAGMIPLAVFGSVLIGVMLLVFVNKKAHNYNTMYRQCEREERKGLCGEIYR